MDIIFVFKNFVDNYCKNKYVSINFDFLCFFLIKIMICFCIFYYMFYLIFWGFIGRSVCFVLIKCYRICSGWWFEYGNEMIFIKCVF